MRLYRAGPAGDAPAIEPGAAFTSRLRPALAVIPFTARTSDRRYAVIGELLADDVITALSRTAALDIISRLSTTVFAARAFSLAEIGRHLDAAYVLSGSYRLSRGRVEIACELADVRSGRIVWSDTLQASSRKVLHATEELSARVVQIVVAAVMTQELARARSEPLPSLHFYTLLMGAIMLMHRGSLYDFNRAGVMLEHLVKHAPRVALPHAWRAKWHVLRFTQGWSPDQHHEAELALASTQRALEADSSCSLAYTIDGFVHTNLKKELDVGQQCYDQALALNPNDSLAWLLKGTLHAFRAEGADAVACTERALKLSPFDPLRYFYESLAATAALSDRKYERAVTLATHSLRANRAHTSTYRALAIAQAELGHVEAARQTMRALLRIDPGFSISRYLESHPSVAYETGKAWSRALRRAGAPK